MIKSISNIKTLDFDLPPELEASEPPEARGLARDEVRLMVSYCADNQVVHTQFRNIGDFLEPGDLLVINTSGTMNAAIYAHRADGTALELHLSTPLPHRYVFPPAYRSVGFARHTLPPPSTALRSTYAPLPLPADLWIVEVRLPSGTTTKPFYDARVGETLSLPCGAEATLHLPYLHDCSPTPCGPTRLWIATLRVPGPLEDYLERYGFPIRYSYVKQSWPTNYYQTVYVTEKGSAEMPSAGRAFTPELITRLVARGVQFAPLLLHTGVASLEEHEPPYEEYYRVPPETARMVNAAHASGKRVIAVGTTVVRALETVTDVEGITYSGEGWTRLVVTPQRGIHAVNALLTGLHEPRATHLAMIEALAAGSEHLQITYAEALREGYLWHEFGDLHLILP